MKFKPKTEKELAEANLWEKGDYAFEILEAEDAQDKNGNDMLKLKVKVFKDSGASQNIFDYVSGTWMEYKLRHLAEACGMLADYENGELNSYEFVGKTGFCKVGISKDKNGEYPDRNGINDYLVDKPASKQTIQEALKDDSIPF
jgi:hypothetical protein